MAEVNKNSWYWLLVIPLAMFGLLGTIIGAFNDNPFSGFLWGEAIGLAVTAVTFIGMFGWEWLKKEMDQGKLLPYILIAIIVSVAVSAYFGFTLGNPSCEEYTDGPRSSCVEYADNGYEVSTEQRWEKFWSSLPITLIIASLIATIVHHNIHRKK